MHPYSAYAYLSIAQLAVAINIVTGKMLVEALPVFTVITLRFCVSAALLALLMKLRNVTIMAPQHPQGRFTRSDYGTLLAKSLTAGVLFNLFFYIGLDKTNAISASIISSTLPVFIAFAFILLKEALSFKQKLGIGLSVIGILSLTVDSSKINDVGSGSLLGDGLVFLAMIPEALYPILASKMKNRVTALGSAFVSSALSFLIMLPIGLWMSTSMEPSSLNFYTISLLVTSGAALMVFFICWPKGLEVVPAGSAGVFCGLIPIMSALLAIILLDETLSITDSVGMLCVLAGIWLGRKSSKKN